jgi:OOP family OmpA-OmpF porin
VSASSEVKRRSIDLTPFYGYNFFQKKQNLKNSSIYGARLAYNIWSHLGLEASLEFINTEVKDATITKPEKGQFVRLLAPDAVNVRFYSLDAVYNILPHRAFTPFLFLGWGGASYNPQIATKDLSALNAGLGLKLAVTDVLSLRVEARDTYVSEKVKEGYHNYNVTVGIQLTIAGEKKEPRVEKPIETIKETIRETIKPPEIVESHIFHFKFGHVRLTRYAQKVLDKLATKLKSKPKLSVRISASTSAFGNKNFNRRLCQKRARVVQDYLKGKGLSRKRLVIIPYESIKAPVQEFNPNDIYSPEALANMRVLLEVVENETSHH